jgi:hypothetical protein
LEYPTLSWGYTPSFTHAGNRESLIQVIAMRKASSTALTSLFASYGSDSDNEDGEIRETSAEGEGEEEKEDEENDAGNETLGAYARKSTRIAWLKLLKFLVTCPRMVVFLCTE